MHCRLYEVVAVGQKVVDNAADLISTACCNECRCSICVYAVQIVELVKVAPIFQEVASGIRVRITREFSHSRIEIAANDCLVSEWEC